MNQFDCIPRNMKIFGRTLEIAGALWLGYSGSGVEFETDAEMVRADILGVSETKTADQLAYLGVFVTDLGSSNVKEEEPVPEVYESENGEEDRPPRSLSIINAVQPTPGGESEMAKRIQVRRDLHTYDICRNPDRHILRIKIVKLTEARNDKVALSVIHAEGNIWPTQWKPHRILFIGDSMTAGYGVRTEASLQDNPVLYQFTTEDEDVTKAFAWQTAQMLGAEAEYFCWSGNGVISRWIGPETDLPLTDDLMPALFPYVDRTTEQLARIYLRAKGWKPPAGSSSVTWLNPAAFAPELIVVNLGTNDASFVRGIPVREQHFATKYLEMLRGIAEFYPGARILLAYGMMEKSLSEANRQVAIMGGFDHVELPLMNPQLEGVAAGGHPSAMSHRHAAQVVCAKVREMLGWEQVREVAPDDRSFFLDT